MLSSSQTMKRKAGCHITAVGLLVFLGLVLPTPGYCQYLTPLYGAAFDEAAFPLTGWTAVPSGAGQFQPAAVSIGLIPTSPSSPAYSNGRGVIISAAPGQGAFVYGPVVTVGADLVLLRLSVHALSGGGSIAVGALNVTPGGTLANADGSANYALEADTARFTADYEYVFAVYRPQGQAIVPFFQLAVNPGMPSAVTAMFDNFEVYPINAETVTDPAWRFIFGFGGIGTPTATPTPPPGATPTMTPTVTPTVPGGATPTPPPATGGLEPGEVYSISPTSDQKEAFSPRTAYDRGSLFAVVAADLTEGYQDVLLRQVNTGDNTVSNPIAVNQGFQDTVAQTPDIAIDACGIRHVVWSDNRSVNPKLFSIYMAELNASGSKLNQNDFEVNGLFENTNTAEPALALRSNGEITVCWRDDRNFLMDVFVRRMRWTGTALQAIDAKDFQVNLPFENTNVSHPDVAVDDQSNIVVIWSDDRVLLEGKKRNDIYARFFTSSTQPDAKRQLPESVPEIQINAFDNQAEQAKEPGIAFQKGVFLAVWRNVVTQSNASSIRGAVFDAQGKILVAEFVIDGGSGQAAAPAVSGWTDGRFLITWYDAGSKQIFGRLYDSVQNAFLTDPVPLVDGVEGLERTGVAAGGGNTGLSVWDGISGQLKDIFGVSILVDTSTLMAVTRPVSVTDAEGRGRTLSASTMSVETARTGGETKAERTETSASRPR